MIAILGVLMLAATITIVLLNIKVFTLSKPIGYLASIVQLVLAVFTYLLFVSFEKKNGFIDAGNSVGGFSNTTVISGIIITILIFLAFIFGFIYCLGKTNHTIMTAFMFITVFYSYSSFLCGFISLFTGQRSIFYQYTIWLQTPLEKLSGGNETLFNIVMASTFILPIIIALLALLLFKEYKHRILRIMAILQVLVPWFVLSGVLTVASFFLPSVGITHREPRN